MATRTRWGFSLSTFFLAACNGSSEPASKQNADDALSLGGELRNIVVEAEKQGTPLFNPDERPPALLEPGDDHGSLQVQMGEEVYRDGCYRCHDSGTDGAPVPGDVEAWRSRLAVAGETRLVRHAIEGFQGERGYMPPKGGLPNLSDQEVEAAVEFMLSVFRTADRSEVAQGR